MPSAPVAVPAVRIHCTLLARIRLDELTQGEGKETTVRCITNIVRSKYIHGDMAKVKEIKGHAIGVAQRYKRNPYGLWTKY